CVRSGILGATNTLDYFDYW
nr:immunoglobulin heavy chain junction region [Macaca mulatta]MOV86827.1 immunoglobulin heavy chain junction region [Macaca mulatta]MOV87209.1 immunoglobulin heavy chain junction region [Macaca mulatta]MOV87221.1 immunoglobulin heavy chain junction region [Macaca mulatta]MOV88444.1 immunoglobulin heavy chain junction region [Macaca mulatta]